jgi:L-serine dehydratase
LVGGLIGIAPDDERLVDAFFLAKKEGLAYRFEIEDETPASANMVLFELTGADGLLMSIRGASIGGGNIMIDQIDSTFLQISMKYNTLIVDHLDRAGAVMGVAGILAGQHINIASMNLYRQGKHGRAYMILETDEEVGADALREISALPDMRAIYIQKLY